MTLPTAEAEQPGMGLVTAHLQDRSGMVTLEYAACTARPGDQRELVLPVPGDLTFDLHRIWVLWAYRFQVNLLQARIPALPSSTSGSEPAP